MGNKITLITFFICIFLHTSCGAQVIKAGNADKQFEYSNISFRPSPSLNSCQMIGEVKNISGAYVGASTFRVSFYDSNNKLLDVSDFGFDHFKNDDTLSFTTLGKIPDCNIGSYKIDAQ